MNIKTLDFDLVVARKATGLSQAEVARRMGTTQSAVSRVESGMAAPTVDFLDRFARALRRPLSLELGVDPKPASAAERSKLVRKVLKGYVFDPWERDPTPEEQRSLEARGLTRERFQSSKTAR